MSNGSQDLLGLAGHDDTVVLCLEPLDDVLLGQVVREPNMSSLAEAVLDILGGTQGILPNRMNKI